MTKFTGSRLSDSASAFAGTIAGFRPGNTTLLQDALGDSFLGLGGNDNIHAGANSDLLDGGVGDDVLEGDYDDDFSFGNDKLFGRQGNDYLSGRGGNDLINPGTNLLNAFGFGFELMVGGRGNDTFAVTASNSRHAIVAYSLEGGGSGVTVNLGNGTGSDTYGNTDTLIGVRFVGATNGNDSLTGGDGDDTFAPGKGTDTIDGGGGLNTLTYNFINQTFAVVGYTIGDLFGYNATGINVIVTLDNHGTVTDPNGFTDSFDNIQIIEGTQYADVFSGSTSDDWFIGGNGADNFVGNDGSDTLDYSRDVIGGATISGVQVNLDAGTATDGFGATDTIFSMENVIGTQFIDTIQGNASDNRLSGLAGNDTLDGAGGHDVLIGGLGRDTLTGGASFDFFTFTSTKDSTKGLNRDIINDFSGASGDGDIIDLAAIDANTTKKGIQHFKFIGTQKFHNKAGELHVVSGGPFVVIVEGDVDGNGKADFQIEVHTLFALQKEDFFLLPPL